MMRMMYVLCPFLIIFCTAYSCSTKSEWKEIDIDLSTYESVIDLHQYAESIKVVKLETNEGCFISRINRIIEVDSLLFLLHKKDKSILVFHSDGRFSHAIRKSGRGRGEYSGLADMAVDKERKVIYVYDDHVRKLIRFDYQGGFIGEMDLPDFLIRSFAIRENGNILAFTPDLLTSLRDGVWEFDTDGNLVSEYADVNENHTLRWSVRPYFTRIDEKYSYLNYYDNHIYTLDQDILERKLKLNIKQKIPDKYVSIPEGVDETFTGNYYMPSSLNETESFYHFRNTSFGREPGNIHVFIEKSSHQLIIADSLIYDFEDYRNIQRIFSNNGKNFFGVLESSANNNPALVVFNLRSIQ